ncbi:hypothetical protein FRC12_009040 [Ceratobasidium sp. 428]|nr:hypothetical protein FRC12_009040 [Ceratobasidium sp. 428]
MPGLISQRVIAILLGRLRMSVDKAILTYLHLSKQMYSGIKLWRERPFNAAAKAKRAVSAIVMETSSSDRMLDTHDDADRCRVLICAISADDPSHPTRLRSYKRLDQVANDFTIWEAVRATSAFHLETLPSGSMMKPNLGCNNPIVQLLDEAFECYEGDRGVACILSLGAGHATGLLPRTGFFPNLRYNKTAPLLKALAADCERTHSALYKRFDRGGVSKVYFRFNLDTGMSGVGADEWNMPGAIVSYIEAYFSSIECDRKIDLLVKNIVARQGSVSIKQAGALA